LIQFILLLINLHLIVAHVYLMFTLQMIC